MKNVLVVYYTQSGQLAEIVSQVVKPLTSDGEMTVTYHEIKPVKPFPFPWAKEAFFDAFPESFQQIPAALEPVPAEIMHKKYDLILLFYQVWYLSPSIPINSFLKSTEAKKLLAGTPVVTISGSRNMWIMAQEKVKSLLRDCGASLKGNIALVDRAGNLVSVVTIVQWMFTGKKDRYLGIFPKAGVSDEDINDSSRFGEIIKKNLQQESLEKLQAELVANDAVKIHPYLVTVDRTANKIFQKWSTLILRKNRSRKTLLKVFNYYLLVAIWVVSPIVYILHAFTYVFKINKIKKETLYYSGV
ncbi:MAG TPA: dialkylresorcinol condensing enzyme DarA [Flavobacterium sp.]|jgi:hypothetical protein